MMIIIVTWNCFYDAFTLKYVPKAVVLAAASWTPGGVPWWWDERGTAARTEWRRWSLSQPASGPLPFLSPRAKPAQLLSLTLRLLSRTTRPGPTQRHPDPHTRLEDTEWRQKGARAACPTRTLPTTPGNGKKKKLLCFFPLVFFSFQTLRRPARLRKTIPVLYHLLTHSYTHLH